MDKKGVKKDKTASPEQRPFHSPFLKWDYTSIKSPSWYILFAIKGHRF